MRYGRPAWDRDAVPGLACRPGGGGDRGGSAGGHRLGQILCETGEDDSVDGQLPGSIGGGLDTAHVGPAAHSVRTDTKQARGLPDRERRHLATVTRVLLQPPATGAFHVPPGPARGSKPQADSEVVSMRLPLGRRTGMTLSHRLVNA